MCVSRIHFVVECRITTILRGLNFMQFEKREDQRTNKHGRVISRAGGHNLVPTCPGVQEVRGGRGQQQPTNKARAPPPAPVPAGSCGRSPCLFFILKVCLVDHPFRLDFQRFPSYSIHMRVPTLAVTPAHSWEHLGIRSIYTASATAGNQSARLQAGGDIA